MIGFALRQVLTWHAKKQRASMDEPLETQREAFLRLKAIFGRGEFAAQTGFSTLHSLEECRGLPVSDGATLKPLFDRVYSGGDSERRIFGESRVTGYGRTSGTQGTHKDIPFNQAYLASLDRTLLRVMAGHFYSTGAWDSLLKGKQVLLGSRPLVATSPTGLAVCDVSGLIPTRTWKSLRPFLYLPRHKDLWTPDWPTKVERILDQAHGKDVRSITGLPALAMDFTRRAKERYGVTHLNQIWPDLRMYIFGAVPLSADQRRSMQESWFDDGKELSFVETYFATEGQLAFSFEPNHPGLALNSLENLYLFYPDSPKGSPLFAHEIEEGVTYSVHITTPGGLINYHMGDRIEVVSRRPLRIRIIGRENDEISMTGEKLTLEQLDLAWDASGLSSAASKSHRPVVWVEHGDRPSLVWGVPDLDPFGERSAKTLDEALCRFNRLYEEALVHERVVGESRLVSVPLSVFERYANTGLGVAQHKPKRLFKALSDFTASYRWEPKK